MTRIAVIEDDLPTSNQLAGWIRSAKSGIVIDQWFTRDEAEAVLAGAHAVKAPPKFAIAHTLIRAWVDGFEV